MGDKPEIDRRHVPVIELLSSVRERLAWLLVLVVALLIVGATLVAVMLARTAF